MGVTWTLSQLVGKPESALFALTNDIKMNKRKWFYDNFNYELKFLWFFKEQQQQQKSHVWSLCHNPEKSTVV